MSTATAKATVTAAPIAEVIHKGKSALGRMRTIAGDISPHDITARTGGKKDKPTVSFSVKGRKFGEDVCASLTPGDVSALSAYQALLRLAEYLEVAPDALSVTEQA